MSHFERRRRTFDGIAEAYDAARPGYPPAVVDAVMAYGRLRSGDRVLELGSGTGIATRLFAARGLAIHCVELAAPMAAVARRRMAELENVTIEVRDFNTAHWPGAAYRGVLAAQSFHWMDQNTCFGRIRRVLRPDGVLALVWNWPAGPSPVVGPAYRAHAPALEVDSALGGVEGRVEAWRARIAASGSFDDIQVRRFPWTLRRSADEYVALIDTYSDHQALPDRDRRALVGAVRRRIQDAGGVIERPAEAVLYLARPRRG